MARSRGKLREQAESYRWLVSNRSTIQDILLQLYDFLRNDSLTKDKGDQLRPTFGLLVGCAYSLWRAAFLADQNRTWDDIMHHIENFLEKLVRDNMIGYIQERDTLDWTVGYYLNNSRLRLLWLDEEILDSETHPVRAKLSKRDAAELKRVKTLDVVKNDPRVVWQANCDTVLAVFQALKSAASSSA